MRGSIRRVLIVGTTGAMIGLLAALGVFLFLMMRTSLIAQFDDALLEKAAVLLASVEVVSGRIVFDEEDLEMDEFHSAQGTGFLQIWGADGAPIYGSPSLAGGSFERGNDRNEEPEVEWVSLPNGRSGRGVRVFFAPLVDDEDSDEANGRRRTFDGGAAELLFARDSSSVTNTLRRLESILLAFGVGAIALSGALLSTVIHRALAPLDALAADIQAVRPDDLSTRIALQSCPDELKPVVERLNDLLARLKNAFDRERGFSADVAHELRTPLAGIRATLEVTLLRSRTEPEYESALRECLAVSDSMQDMVENLLTLARLDTGEFEIVREEVELDVILDAALGPLRPAFAARNMEIRWEVDSGLLLESDSTLLHIVARNLLDNALAHANDGGWVRVEAHRDGAKISLRVSNSGCRITQDQIEHAFDRFWRADASRSGSDAHCGLGLSLVRKILTTLGGGAEASTRDRDVFEIAVELPRRPTRD